MWRQRPHVFEMHPLRLLLGKLVHRRVERRNSLTFDEERRPKHLVLDRLLIDLYVNRQPRQALEKRLPNMKVLSVAPLLAEAIRRIHVGESVGGLFDS